MVDYATYKNKSFATRQEAEAWAKEQKATLKAGDVGVAKIDIDFVKETKTWKAKILLPV